MSQKLLSSLFPVYSNAVFIQTIAIVLYFYLLKFVDDDLYTRLLDGESYASKKETFFSSETVLWFGQFKIYSNFILFYDFSQFYL